MPEKGKSKPEYPTTLDVVRRGGEEYQVVGTVQTGKQSGDLYILKNPKTEEVFRVKGAEFKPTSTSEPGAGNVHKREEGVRVTGTLEGGKRED